jgi:hypothetical protein
MAQPLEKVCTLCGVDLNGQKRVKNASGQYFCPSCWKSQNSIFGESTAVAGDPPPSRADVTPPPPARTPAGLPTVRVVGSKLEPTIGKAVLQGVKEGAASATFRLFRKGLIFLQLILVLGLTKKLFPDTNNGVMIILTLTSVIAGVVEVDLLARAMKFKDVWIDGEMLKSRAGILIMIGLVLAYALAIFLAIGGG